MSERDCLLPASNGAERMECAQLAAAFVWSSSAREREQAPADASRPRHSCGLSHGCLSSAGNGSKSLAPPDRRRVGRVRVNRVKQMKARSDRSARVEEPPMKMDEVKRTKLWADQWLTPL
jgi:hypothetical protein